MSETNVDNRLEKTREKVLEDLKIDQIQLIEECKNNLPRTHRYITMLHDEEQKLSRLESALNRKRAVLYKHFRWDSPRKSRSVSDLEQQIVADEGYIEIKDAFETQKKYVSYLERVVDLFKQRGWTIKNIIDLRKLEEDF